MPRVHFANSSPTRVPAEPHQQTQMQDIPEQFTPQDHDMLRVSPQDFLKFSRGDSKDCTVELSCIFISPVTYKIQTTSPEKFRVRPRCGILHPGESVNINIFLKPEHMLSDNGKDKFLIMCLPSMDIQATQVADFWKQHGQQSANMEQHRLCCTYYDSATPPSGSVNIGNGLAAQHGDESRADDYDSRAKKLEKQLKYMQIMQVFTLIFLLILSGAVIYLLKLQLCTEEGCMFRSGSASSADSADFETCSKGKADL